MCELIRTIWPVGHGAFYTEVFDTSPRPMSVVYDCGGKDTQIIQKNIKSFLSSLPQVNGKPIVDMVFISHFHKDHINGLKYLLKNADVKNLIIPQIDQNALLEAYLYNACANVDKEKKGDINSDAQQIIYELATVEHIEQDTNLVQVEHYDLEDLRRDNQANREGNDNTVVYEAGTRNGLGGTLTSGKIISVQLGRYWWEYIPVNIFKNTTDKINILIKDLEKIKYKGNPLVNQGQVDFSRLKSYLKDNIVKEIKEAYEKVFGKNDNIYSMPVYSGPVEYESEKYVLLHSSVDCLCNFWECCRRHHCYVSCFKKYIRLAVSCLYTGDFEPKSKLNGQSFVNIVKNILKRRWDHIGMVQIPHHASSNNYSDDLYEIPRLAFANVNNHGDISFSQSVIRGIYRNECRAMIVTEKDKQQYFDILF